MSQEGSSKKEVVHIMYPCFLCGGEYGTANGAIQHIKAEHGYVMIPRPPAYHRPVDKRYDYESSLGGRWDSQHYGCPSCWFHAPKDLEAILEHVMNVHSPQLMEGFIPDREDELDELEDEESDQEDEQNDENKPETNNQEGEVKNKENENQAYDNESEKGLSLFFKDEKEIVIQACNMLAEMSDLFKKLTEKEV